MRPKQLQVGTTVLVKADGLTYEGTVTELLDSQFIYHITHINNQPSPMARSHKWEKFCFYKNTFEWSVKKRTIDGL
jgi:hypothetical protein